jgi:DNA-binding LacI/PurR family transcriptional regulator
MSGETETGYRLKPEMIAEKIREYIRNRLLRPGDRLPSERQFAQEYRVTHSMVRSANEALIHQGWVAREHGRGTFVGVAAADNSRSGVIPQLSPKIRTLGYLAVGTKLTGYTMEQYRRMEALARAENMRVVFGNVTTSDERPIPQNFADEMVSGFVVDGDFDDAYLRRLQGVSMPVVVAGNHPQIKGITQIHINIAEFYRQVVMRYAEAGHRFIWIALEPLRLYYTRELLRGYREGMREAGLLELCVLDAETEPILLARQIALSWQLFGPKQAILYGMPVHPFLQALHSYNIDYSNFDIAVLSSLSSAAPIGYTELNLPIEEMGNMAPRVLLSLLRGKRVNSLVFEPVVTSKMEEGHAKLHVQWRHREEV